MRIFPFLTALLLVCCTTGEAPPADVPARIDLLVGARAVRFLGPSTAPTSSVHGRLLAWEFHATSGTEAHGTIADPRRIEAEGVDDAELYAPTGVVTLDLPASSGEIVVRFAGGAEIGRALVDPSAVHSDDELIDLSRDFVGRPRRLAGDATARVSFLVVPEGYTEAELPAFHDHARRLIAGLAKTDGYDHFFHGISVWMQDVKSHDSGITDPEHGVVKNTAFGVSFGKGALRRAISPAADVQDASFAAMTAIARRVRADATIVLVNVREHAGMRVGQSVFVSNSDTSVLTIGHELGHLLFGLADEYTEHAGPCEIPLDRPRPNVADSLDALPWKDLLTTHELPTTSTTPGTVGAFEGAKACEHGLWRPQLDCKMRSLGVPFCKVCRRALETFFRDRGVVAR